MISIWVSIAFRLIHPSGHDILGDNYVKLNSVSIAFRLIHPSGLVKGFAYSENDNKVSIAFRLIHPSGQRVLFVVVRQGENRVARRETDFSLILLTNV